MNTINLKPYFHWIEESIKVETVVDKIKNCESLAEREYMLKVIEMMKKNQVK